VTNALRVWRVGLRIMGVGTGVYDAKLKDVSGRTCIVRNIKLTAGEISSDDSGCGRAACGERPKPDEWGYVEPLIPPAKRATDAERNSVCGLIAFRNRGPWKGLTAHPYIVWA
jgi:hypothetical protein